MIGRCSSCGNQTEVNTIPVENGTYRVACHHCEAGGLTAFQPNLLSPERFRMLVGRLLNRTILDGERLALRWNLIQMQKELNQRQRKLNLLMREVGR